MKKAFVKYLLAGILLFLLWAPLLQQELMVFKGGELRGAFEKPDDISFTFKNWFDGTYASKKENYVRYHFGFQGDLVRLYNQIEYSVFDLATADNVVIGKQKYVYEQRYIDSYYGKDFKGDSVIKQKTLQLKKLQDTLQNHGIFLFVVFAPGKGSFYPEYIPYNQHRPRGRTNYQACIEACNKTGVNYIDFEKYFLAMKDTSRYPLYSRGGIHWSYYGDVLAFDSMVRYIHLKTGFEMPLLKIDSVKTDTHPQFRDNDAVEAMNLITMYDKDTLAYPSFSATDSIRKLNFMTIGDSYYWQMQMSMSPLIFKDCAFWYYFDKMYFPDKPRIEGREAHERLIELVLQQNVICIMETDAALNNFGFGFQEDANAKFKTR